MFRLWATSLFVVIGFLSSVHAAAKTGVVYHPEGEITEAPTPPPIIRGLPLPSDAFDGHGLGLEMYAPVSEEVENKLCRTHSRQFLDGLRTQQTWALRMFDSSAKLPSSGLLDGNLVLLGDYDECLAIENIDDEKGGTFSGQHCMVALGARSYFTETILLEKWKAYPSLPKVFEILDHIKTTPMALQEALSQVGMMWSVCVPSSCEAEDVADHVQRSLRAVMGNITVSSSNLMCNSRTIPPPPVEPLDWVLVGVLATIGVLAVASTVFDILTSKREQRPWLLLAFSIPSNTRALFSAERPSDAIGVLDGMRVFSTLWVVFVHQFQYNLYGPIINLRSLQTMASDMNLLTFTNGSLCVDSFLLFSGILVAYNFMREKERKTFSLIRFYLNRFIRLTPSLAMMTLLVATAPLLSESPFSRSNHEAGRDSCQKNGWKTLLYLNNYFDDDHSCLAPAWYLGMDMQLYVLSPLILYPLWKYRKLGKLLLGGFIGAGVIVAFTIPFVNHIPVNDFMGATSGIDGKLQYYPTHARFTPWLIGVGLGALLYKTRKTEKMELKTYVLVLGWIGHNVFINGAILPFVLFFQPGYEYDPFVASLYIALRRPAWALGLGWLVFTCARGHGGLMNKVLSCRVFRVLGKLSYSVFLVHWPLVISQVTYKKTPEHYSYLNMFIQFMGTSVMSFYLATFLYLLVEAPASVIGKALLSKTKKTVQMHKPSPSPS